MLPMFRSLPLWLGLLYRCFRSHRGLLLENLALRRQLIVFKRKHAKPRLSLLDKLFWARSPLLARMEALSHGCYSGDRGALAPCRLQHVLEPDLEGEKAGWQKKDLERGQGLDLSPGSGESYMGCSSHSWRAPHAWLRCFGANYLPLDEMRAQRSRAGATLAGLSSQPSRSHRRHGLLYRTHRHFQPSVLFLHHWPMTGGAFSTSTLRVIPLAPGLPSNCERPSPISLPPSSSSLITMQSMDGKFQPRFDP